MKKIGLFLLISWGSLCTYSQPFDHTPSATVISREINISETIRRFDPDKFLYIDIDNDGTNDMVFSLASEADNVFFIRVHPTNNQPSTKLLSIQGCNPSSFAATVNQPGRNFIEQNSGDWNGSIYGSGGSQVKVADNYCTDEPNFLNKGFNYLGVQFKKNANTHYAWVLIKINNIKDVNDFMTIEVKSLAYESIISQGIQAGDDGSPVVSLIEIQGAGGVHEIVDDYGTLQMEASLLPIEAQGRTILWSLRESDSNFATINENGKIQALKNGTVRVYAVVDDMNRKIDSADITIANQKIHLELINVFVKGGGDFVIDTDFGSLEFDVEFIPENADDSFKHITWKPSGNASSTQYFYATIDSLTSLVQATNDAGGTPVTAQFMAESSDPNGVHENFSVLISNQTERLVHMDLSVVDAGSPVIDIDKGSLQLLSNTKPSFDYPISWMVDNQHLATIAPNENNSSTAILNALNNGTVNAICYWEDPSVNGRIVSDTLPVDISNQLTTGINGIESGNKNMLFPNPASSHSIVFVRTKEVVEHVEIRTISGKLINYTSIGTKGLYLKDICQGVYLVTIHMYNKTFFTKLLFVK